jgi:tRNA modification GTPase
MFSTLDTIVAIATPPGRGGIGIVRVSGPDAHRIAQELTAREQSFKPRYATLVTVRLNANTTYEREAPVVASGFSRTSAPSTATSAIDQALVTYFPAPASYTGDDVVEISAHGSPVVLTTIVNAAVDRGARLAEPGEFTLRAYVNGRIDLPQAEAVADLIDAATPLQARAAFDQLNGTLTETVGAIDRALFDLIARLEASVDFPEDGYHFVDPSELAVAIDSIRERTTALLCSARRGRLIRDGLTVAIIGKPNVGKSSVFNALVGTQRAIVTDVPGTTRDLVSETVDIEGLRVTLVDTAGLRETADVVESEGVSRSVGAASVADLVLMVCDLSDRSTLDEFSDVVSGFPGSPKPNGEGGSRTGNASTVLVANKADLARAWSRKDVVEVCATSGSGIDQLRRRIVRALDVDLLADRPEITNVRHIALVERADRALQRARLAALADGQAMPEEFVLADLQEARAAFEEITGRRTPDDLLAHIFARFCIGK